MNYMRWLFGILLLANISFFVWKSGDEINVAHNQTPVTPVPGVPGLQLLSEAPATAQVAVAKPPVPSARPGPEATPEPPASSGRSEISDERAPAAVEPAPESAEPTPKVAVVTAPKADPFCVRLGPFAEEKPARDAISDLAASQVFATLTVEGEARPPRYIVYLEPAASRQEALETLRELRGKKIDSFVFSSGDLRNGISLGIFSQQASTQRLRQKMKRTGYDARLLTRKRETQRFWIALGPKNAQRFSTDLHAALQERYREADYQRETCP